MKAVMLSIKPKYCELIANGKKTVEVRKTKPKLETPFKCYVYCTKDGKLQFWTNKSYSYADDHRHNFFDRYGNGKVIGEFICDRIDFVRNYGDMVDSYDCIASCLSAREIIDYAKDKNGNFVYTYGWHISNLVIYDKPKELSEFYVRCDEGCEDCNFWQSVRVNSEEFDMDCASKLYGHIPLKRPPQSWCYVEDLEVLK